MFIHQPHKKRSRFRPAQRGAFLCFLHIKSHHKKTWWLIGVLPLILHAIMKRLFSI